MLYEYPCQLHVQPPTCVGIHQADKHRVREALARLPERGVCFAGIGHGVKVVRAAAVLTNLRAGGQGL